MHYDHFSHDVLRPAVDAAGQKGPPSAPPSVPPIIINPFSYHTPRPAIDPHITPEKPPVTPPARPRIRAPGAPVPA